MSIISLIDKIISNTEFTFYSFKKTSYKNFLTIFKDNTYYDNVYSILNDNYNKFDINEELRELLILFKIKSLLTLILLNSYKKLYKDTTIRIQNVYSNGILNKISDNSYYTIINVGDSLKFVKIVDYIFREKGSSVITFQQDNIIYDIVNGYIFNYIMSKNGTYKDYCLRYECSFLSYYQKGFNSRLYWDYNKIVENYNKFISKYNNQTVFYNCCFICINRYIDNYSLFDLFKNYKHEYSKHIDVILTNGFIDFFKFISYIEFEYGFKHNDLHCANVIFDKKNKKLVMIDYGRSIFSEYIHTENNVINNFLKKEMYKLNLNETNNYYRYNSFINSYKKLIEFDKMDEFYYNKISKINGGKKYYYLCVFEICELCRKFYVIFVDYLDTINKKDKIQSLYIYKISHEYYESYIDYDLLKEHFLIAHKEISELSDSHYLYNYKETLLLINEAVFIYILCKIASDKKITRDFNIIITELFTEIFNKENYDIYIDKLKNFSYILYPETHDSENYDDEEFEEDEEEYKGGNKIINVGFKKIRKLKKY